MCRSFSTFSFRVLAAALALAVPSAAGAAKGPQSFRGEYTLSYLGLSVATAKFSSRYDGDDYSIDGNVASAGIAQIFDDTTGTMRASGHFAGGRIQPRAFRADYKYGKKTSMIDIRFADGKVVSTKIMPKPKKHNKKWVPVDIGDLSGVTDPIAATVIHADSLDKVCGRTVKLYDGEMRADLRLDYVSSGTISVKGYEGATVICKLSFEPVAGYHKGKRSLEYLRKKSRIMVTFAPLGQTGVYAPVYATVGTEIGTITVSAQRFEATD